MATSETLKFFCKMIISMGKEEVIEILELDKINYRFTREDDKGFAVTCDFDSDRLNLEVDNGLITKVDIG